MILRSGGAQVVMPGAQVYSSVMGGWSPTDLASLVAWWDFSDTSRNFTDAGTTPVISDADAIYQVNDKSAGTAANAVQTASASRALHKKNIKNGQSIGRFDGSNDIYVISQAQALPCYVYVALDTTNIGTGYRALLERDVSGGSPYPPVLLSGNTTINYAPAIYWGTGTILWWGAGVRGWAIVRYRLESTTAGIRVNGGTEVTASHALSAKISTWTSICYDVAQQAQIDLAEMLMFQGSALSAGDDTAIMNYLNAKWAIY